MGRFHEEDALAQDVAIRPGLGAQAFVFPPLLSSRLGQVRSVLPPLSKCRVHLWPWLYRTLMTPSSTSSWPTVPYGQCNCRIRFSNQTFYDRTPAMAYDRMYMPDGAGARMKQNLNCAMHLDCVCAPLYSLSRCEQYSSVSI